MPWTGKFKPPLALKDGRAIETLADARRLILALPEHQQRRPYWQYAGQLLMNAAQEAIEESLLATVAQGRSDDGLSLASSALIERKPRGDYSDIVRAPGNRRQK